MGWKTWPYWLKGGIIPSLVYLLIACIFFILGEMELLNKATELILTRLFMIMSIPTITSFYAIFPDYSASFFNITTITATGYFIIGAIIGWIYGKIKNRNSNY